jgi:hypothetical protein
MASWCGCSCCLLGFPGKHTLAFLIGGTRLQASVLPPKIRNVIVNASIEPQVTAYHHGSGLPSFQLFTGLYFLFPQKND